MKLRIGVIINNSVYVPSCIINIMQLFFSFFCSGNYVVVQDAVQAGERGRGCGGLGGRSILADAIEGERGWCCGGIGGCSIITVQAAELAAG